MVWERTLSCGNSTANTGMLRRRVDTIHQVSSDIVLTNVIQNIFLLQKNIFAYYTEQYPEAGTLYHWVTSTYQRQYR